APLVAQIPIRVPTPQGGATGFGSVESISLLFDSHDLLIYDVGTMAPHSFWTGAEILRHVQGRLRTFSVSGTPAGSFTVEIPLQLVGGDKPESPTVRMLHGYDR